MTSTMDAMILAILVIFILYLLNKLLNLNKNKKLPPGPIALPILGHFHLLGTSPHKSLCKLARKYGPIMHLRFGSVPTIVISSPEAAELVLKTHDLNFASRPHLEASKYMAYGQRGLVFSRDTSYWRNMRKLVTLELLSQHRINQFQPLRKAEVDVLVNSLKQSAKGGERVDLSDVIFSTSADLICQMVFGRKSADLDMDGNRFRHLFMESQQLGARFNLADYFPYMGVIDLQGINRQLKSMSKVFDVFFEKIIDDHVNRETNSTRVRDFVDTLMSVLGSRDAGFEFDRRHVKETLVSGSDTSASTIEWTLSELLKNPPIMKKVQKELQEVVGMENMVEESHLESIQYLDCVIKETLRLHPVAPLLLPHESIEDSLLNDFYIPKKSRILVNVWAIGRDSTVWCNPEIFSPERFIGSDISAHGQDFRFIPFGSGRRGCPGLQLGLLMVRLVVAQLVHCFDWELPDGILPSELDMSDHFGFVVSRTNHLMATPNYRLRM